VNPQTPQIPYGPRQIPYGPRQTAPRSARGEIAVGLPAALLWMVTLCALSLLTILVGMWAFWLKADGAPWADVRAFVLPYALPVAGAAVVLAALALAPGVRRLTPLTRLLLLGVLACPVPTGLLAWTWFRVG
jgi:hypothetical protein